MTFTFLFLQHLFAAAPNHPYLEALWNQHLSYLIPKKKKYKK